MCIITRIGEKVNRKNYMYRAIINLRPEGLRIKKNKCTVLH